MTPKEELLQKVQSLVEGAADNLMTTGGSIHEDGVYELVSRIGELFEGEGKAYGLFNTLAEGWVLTEEEFDAEMARRKDVDDKYHLAIRRFGDQPAAASYIEDVAARKPLKVVPADKRYYFTEPFRVIVMHSQALRVLDEVRKRRAYDLDRERGPVLKAIGGVELRVQCHFMTSWEKTSEEEQA